MLPQFTTPAMETHLDSLLRKAESGKPEKAAFFVRFRLSAFERDIYAARCHKPVTYSYEDPYHFYWEFQIDG